MEPRAAQWGYITVRLLTLTCLLALGATASAETVKLRKKDNGNIIDVEVVEVAVDKVSFRLPGADRVYTVDWDSLDTAWLRRNSAAVWNEHELLLQPAQAKEEKKPDPAADPFAKESPPADTKELIKNLASTLGDRMKGIEPWTISAFCKENGLEESAFWKGYDELRRASGTYTEAKAADGADKPSKSSRTKDSGRDRPSWERDPAGLARENQLKAEWEKGHAQLTALGYVRTLAEGGYKARLAWQFLRTSAEDRKGIVSRLRKYETLAGELAERADKADAKRDALVLRKLLGDVAASFERISKDSNVQEERLKVDCQSLLTRLSAGR